MTFKRFWCHFSRLRSSNCSHIKHNSVFFGSLLEGVVGVSREGGWDTPRRVAWSISREGGSGPPPPTLLHRFASSFAIAMSSLSCFPPTGPCGIPGLNSNPDPGILENKIPGFLVPLAGACPPTNYGESGIGNSCCLSHHVNCQPMPPRP